MSAFAPALAILALLLGSLWGLQLSHEHFRRRLTMKKPATSILPTPKPTPTPTPEPTPEPTPTPTPGG